MNLVITVLPILLLPLNSYSQFQQPYSSYSSAYCEVKQLRDGFILSDRNPIPAGGNAQSFCNPGYILDGGGSTLTCQPDGAFSPSANCIPNPLPDSRTGSPIGSGSQLKCSFDGFDSCQWGSDGSHATPWLEATYIPPEFNWMQKTGSNTKPDGKFAIIYPKGYDADILLSDPIPCQRSDVPVSFKYWLSGDANFKVCAVPSNSRGSNSADYLWCSRDFLGADAFNPGASVVVPAQDEEFKLAFVPSGGSGFVAVDDIDYKVDTVKCTNVCDLLNCNFESGNTCQWTARTPVGAPSQPLFSVHNRRLGNRDTGTKWPSGTPGTTQYAGVLFNPDIRGATTSILESPELNIQEPIEIEFPLYESTRDMYAQLCFNSLDNCPYSSNQLTSEDEHHYWQRVKETIPPGTRKIFIKAVNAGRYNGAVGVDDITVSSPAC